MARAIKVADAEDILPGTMREVSVEGEDALIANVEGQFHAIGNRCPHLNSRLSQGILDGQIVTCPGHGSRFDVSDGSVVAWATKIPGLISKVSQVVRPQQICGSALTLPGWRYVSLSQVTHSGVMGSDPGGQNAGDHQ